jgi:hypothetical protein
MEDSDNASEDTAIEDASVVVPLGQYGHTSVGL